MALTGRRNVTKPHTTCNWLNHSLGLSTNEVVLLLRLSGLTSDLGTLYHDIFVDSCERVMWDCTDRFGINLSTGSIAYFVGYDVVFRGITELRQVENQ